MVLCSARRATAMNGYLGWVGSGGASLVLLVTGFFVLYPLALLVYGSFVVTRADGSDRLRHRDLALRREPAGHVVVAAQHGDADESRPR